MRKHDETTASELNQILQANSIKLSRSTILHCHRQVGWTYRGATDQGAQQAEKAFMVHGKSGNWIHNVLWTDEPTGQLENHSCFSHKEKPRPNMYMYLRSCVAELIDIQYIHMYE